MTAIPWIPILSAGAGLLGSLFGDEKKTNQSENSTTVGSDTSLVKSSLDSQTNQSQTQTQNSNQSSSQSSTQDVTQKVVEQQTGAVSRLDATTLDALTQAVQSGLATDGDLAALRTRLAQINGSPSSFDANGYVENIMRSARSDVAGQIESGVGNVRGRVGATGKTNSAAALLEAKIKNQGAATLAGIQGDAGAKAEQLRIQAETAKTGQITDLASATTQGSQNLLNALLQARETQVTTGTSQSGQQTVGNTSGMTTGTTNTNTSTTENQSSDQVQGSTSTNASQTKGTIKQNSSELNWGDLFSNLGKALASSF